MNDDSHVSCAAGLRDRGTDSVKHAQRGTALAQRARKARIAAQVSEQSGSPPLQVSADEAFLGHEFKGRAAKYEHDGPYLVCALTWWYRSFFFLVSLAGGPGLTLLLVAGDINSAMPVFAKVAMACLSGILWVVFVRMFRFHRRVFFDFESGQAIFIHRTFRTEYLAMDLGQITGIDKIKIIRPRGKESKLVDRQAYLDSLPEAAKIACYCLILRLENGERVNVLETTDGQMVEKVKGLLDSELNRRRQ